MTPDELRALADALSRQRQADEHGIYCAVPRQAVDAAIRHLRAQADAQPVAEVIWYDPRPRLTDDVPGKIIDASIAFMDATPLGTKLYTHPAPAVPHPSADASRDAYEGCREDLSDWKRRALMAEREARNLAKALADTVNGPTFMGEPADRCRSSETSDPKATGRSSPERPASNREDAAAMVAAGSGEQAEPKREPLTYEQLVSACYTYRHDFGLLDPDEQELVIEEAGRWAKAFGIGGSDAE